jgi:hypothetical protein
VSADLRTYLSDLLTAFEAGAMDKADVIEHIVGRVWKPEEPGPWVATDVAEQAEDVDRWRGGG